MCCLRIISFLYVPYSHPRVWANLHSHLKLYVFLAFEEEPTPYILAFSHQTADAPLNGDIDYSICMFLCTLVMTMV